MSSEKDFEDDEFNDDLPREYREDVPGSLTNSIGMKLVPIPAGTFLMGSPEDKKFFKNELQHEVTLTEDFYLGMTQVTQAQYKEVMGKNPSYFQGDKVAGRDSSEFPVETVSWDHQSRPSASRNATEQSESNNYFGFRVALSPFIE